ncbi:MAG: zinc ribbon domain-containing protein [Candidatus Methanoperedens sp.]|nr:zinc ribbon domain-containing protein [Candidatus Methanoperedens sp.]
MIPDKQNEMEDIKSHKDKISKINTLLDKLDERLACGEITEARYTELRDRYKSEAEKLKDHLTEQELMHEVGLEAGEDEVAEYREEEPEEAVPAQRNTKYCSNCGALIDEMAEICPRCGVRVMIPQAYRQKKNGGIAAFLSAIIPGLGQIYCGRGMRGVGVFLLNFVLLFSFGSASSENPNSDGTGFLFLLVIIAWIWNILDARKIAKTVQ